MMENTIPLAQPHEPLISNLSLTLSINAGRNESHHIDIQVPENIGSELIHQLKNVLPAAVAQAARSDYVSSTSAKRNKVKRPMNSFLVFASHMRPILQAENKDLNNAQISKLLGTKWQMMSEVDRASYVEAATKIRAEFSAAHPDYVYTKTPRKHKKRKLATEAEMLKAEAEEADIRKRLAASSTSALHSSPLPVRVPSPALPLPLAQPPPPQPQSLDQVLLPELDFLQELTAQSQQQQEQPPAQSAGVATRAPAAVPHVDLLASLDMLPDNYLLPTAPPPPLEITSFFENAFL